MEAGLTQALLENGNVREHRLKSASVGDVNKATPTKLPRMLVEGWFERQRPKDHAGEL